MSFWLMRAVEGDTPEVLKQRAWVTKPGLDPQDYSKARVQKEIRQQLLTLDADAPPEALALQTQIIWQFVHAIDVEDIICTVWFKGNKPQGVCFAQVTGRAFAEPLSDSAYEHRVPVQWYDEQVGVVRLRSYLFELEKAGAWPVEITNAKFKLALRNCLPLPGNKFARWKWLIIFVVCVKIFMLTVHMLQRGG